jgi:hypothetical protein
MREELVNLRRHIVAFPRAPPHCIPTEQLILPAAASSTDDAHSQAHQQVPSTVPNTKVNLGHVLPAVVSSTQLTYRDVASTGILPRRSSSLPDNEGFQTVTYKRVTTARSPPAALTSKRRRQPLVRARNTQSLPIVSKPRRSKALFVTRFNPEVTADDVQKIDHEATELE